MTDVDKITGDATEPVDGRVARRQRNIDAVIDVVLEMFAEESMFPTMEQAAKRSGLSLRSLYRYFADPGELLEATITRSDERGRELARLPAIGEGPLEERIEQFVAMRLALHAGLGPVMRATAANAHRLPRIHAELTRNRNAMFDQFALQFAPELKKLKPAEKRSAITSGDLLTQIDSIDYLRRHRQLSVAEVQTSLVSGLTFLLG